MSTKLLTIKFFLLIVLASILSSCQIIDELEPNDTFETATPLSIIPKTRASLFPRSDKVDFYSISGTLGQRLFLVAMPAFSTGNTELTMSVYRADKVTLLETDTNNSTSPNLGASISNLELPATETYYVKIEGTDVRPYYLYVDDLVAGAVIPTETEPNNTYATSQSLPTEPVISGAISASDTDIFKVNLDAGTRVFISLDLEPAPDNTPFNGKLSFSNSGQNLIVASESGTVRPGSVVLFATVKEAGTYHITVSDLEGTGGANYNYILNVDSIPFGNINECQQFSNSSPLNISDNKLSQSIINITEDINVGRLLVDLDLDHTRLSDLDLVLESPKGTQALLFDDLLEDSTTNLKVVLADHEGAFPVDFFQQRLSSYIMQPEKSGRLENFRGVKAKGNWKLKIYDDRAKKTGTLNSWKLYLCPDSSFVSKELTCQEGFAKSTVLKEDFKKNNGQLKSSGRNSQWTYGKPTLAASSNNARLDKCNTGKKCWKTNLNGLYNSSSKQILKKQFSLVGASSPIALAWSQRYQLDAANKSSYTVKIKEKGSDTNKRILYQYLQDQMEQEVGSNQTIHESAGWGEELKDIGQFSEKEVQLSFELKTKSARPYAGVAIDDLEVLACFPDSDLDGVADRDEI